MRASDSRTRPRGAVALAVGIGAVAVLLVAASLHRPEPRTSLPSPTLARLPAGAGAGWPAGVVERTVDASRADQWRLFSLRAGAVLEVAGPEDWDLAFRRFRVIGNGGAGFGGDVRVADLGLVDFDAVDAGVIERLPPAALRETRVRSDSVHPAFDDWYHYHFLSHLLSPAGRSYLVRSVDGAWVVLQFTGYYCPGPVPGCVRFRYRLLSEGPEVAGRGDPAAGLPVRADPGPSHPPAATPLRGDPGAG
jgi:hypothetical protein